MLRGKLSNALFYAGILTFFIAAGIEDGHGGPTMFGVTLLLGAIVLILLAEVRDRQMLKRRPIRIGDWRHAPGVARMNEHVRVSDDTEWLTEELTWRLPDEQAWDRRR